MEIENIVANQIFIKARDGELDGELHWSGCLQPTDNNYALSVRTVKTEKLFF